MGQQYPAPDPRASTTRLQRSEAILTGLGPAGWFAALEAVPNAVIVYDSDRRILYLNRAGRVRANLSLEDTVGRRDTDIFPAYATLEYLPLLERAFTSREPVTGECRITIPARSNEEPRQVVFSVSYTPVFDAEGALECVVAITSDLTVARRYQDEAQALRAILENAGIALVTIEASGIVTSFNARAERLYGYVAQEIVGQSFSRLFEPRAASEAEVLLGRLRRGQTVEYKGYRRNKQGLPLELSLTLSPILDPSGQLTSIVETALPIRAEARAPSALEAGSGRGVASIAHELNNALTVVETYTALLTEEPLPDGARSDLDLARRAARKSASLVADLLAAQRVPATSLPASAPPPLDTASMPPASIGADTPAPRVGESGGRAVVLVVDDDPEVRESMRRLLAECDLLVLTASSGLHALQLLQERRVDAVVVDQLMPGLEGVQLLSIVRERWPGTARVLFTGHASPAVVLEAVNHAGAHKVLVKSMHALEIRNEIEASALVAARRAARR